MHSAGALLAGPSAGQEDIHKAKPDPMLAQAIVPNRLISPCPLFFAFCSSLCRFVVFLQFHLASDLHPLSLPRIESPPEFFSPAMAASAAPMPCMGMHQPYPCTHALYGLLDFSVLHWLHKPTQCPASGGPFFLSSLHISMPVQVGQGLGSARPAAGCSQHANPAGRA